MSLAYFHRSPLSIAPDFPSKRRRIGTWVAGKREARRRRRYRQGALARERLSGGSGYACPLCTRVFPDISATRSDGELSIEDIPPDAVPGPSLEYLTCEDCNVGGGRTIDRLASDLSKREEWESGRRTLPGGLSIDGAPTVHPEITLTEDGFRADGEFGIGDPRLKPLQDAAKSSADSGASVPFSIKLDLAVDRGGAARSFLRAGYLVAFGLFGYRYILSNSGALVRGLVSDEPQAAAELGDVVFRTNLDGTERSAWLSEGESAPRVLVLTLGSYLVLLPHPDQRDDIRAYVSSARAWDQGVPLTRLEWPNVPAFRLDAAALGYGDRIPDNS